MYYKKMASAIAKSDYLDQKTKKDFIELIIKNKYNLDNDIVVERKLKKAAEILKKTLELESELLDVDYSKKKKIQKKLKRSNVRLQRLFTNAFQKYYAPEKFVVKKILLIAVTMIISAAGFFLGCEFSSLILAELTAIPFAFALLSSIICAPKSYKSATITLMLFAFAIWFNMIIGVGFLWL